MDVASRATSLRSVDRATPNRAAGRTERSSEGPLSEGPLSEGPLSDGPLSDGG